MFSSAYQLGSRRPSATNYREVNASTAIEGASSHKLVSLLYQAITSQISSARGAIARSDISEKCRAIGHAVRIIEEGLIAPLNVAAGGALAVNLSDLYHYLVQRLTLANAKSDDAMLAECANLVEVIRDGWDAIGQQVNMPALAAA
jgi:flagellar protein FliS